MRDKHEALRSSTTRVRGPVQVRSDETPSLVVVLSPSTELMEGHVNATAINRVHWGARLALTAVLPHFPLLEPEFELLGSGYNVNLMKDEMEAFWTQTRRASESLPSRVPLLATRSPPNADGDE
jgi:hypothetical protein